MKTKLLSILAGASMCLANAQPAQAAHIDLEILADNINDVCDKNGDGWVDGFDWVLMSKTEKFENTAKIVTYIIAKQMEAGGQPIDTDKQWMSTFYVVTKMVQPKIENYYVRRANRAETIAVVAGKYVVQESVTLRKLLMR